MFNLNKHAKTSQLMNIEKMLRKDKLSPKAGDGHKTTEKELNHKGKDTESVTEKQMKSMDRNAHSEYRIIEKVLNEAKEKYNPLRSDATWLSVPPISALVEKIRQKRIDSHFKTDKAEHWSMDYKNQDQNGSLPEWPGNAAQHDKIVLQNDPRRFTGVDTMPTEPLANDNIKALRKSKSEMPLVGGITVADIDRVSHNIKTGQSVDYDTAIVAILKQADQEKRELNEVEQKMIADIKKNRTAAMLAKSL